MLLIRSLRVFSQLRSRPSLILARHSSSVSGAAKPYQNWQAFVPTYEEGFDAASFAMYKKRKLLTKTHEKQQNLLRNVHATEGTSEEVLAVEADALLKKASRSRDDAASPSQNGSEASKTRVIDVEPLERQVLRHISPEMVEPVELGKEVELDIVELSSTGDGLAYTSNRDHVVVVPFSVPGDRVLAKVHRWQGLYSMADFIKVVNPSSKREGVTPQCKYFSTCSGCQLQMLSYEDQLEHKTKIVENAFRHFSGLSAAQMPRVEPTIGSPLQYSYRTKLTPHFDGLKKKGPFKSVPDIGFNKKGWREVLDIESCPIATDIVQEGLKFEREKVAANLKSYKYGATILIRETTERIPNGVEAAIPATATALPVEPGNNHTIIPESKELTHDSVTNAPKIKYNFLAYTDVKTHTSDEAFWSTEYVDNFIFTNRAGSFFQNNNSILSKFIPYIRRLCQPSKDAADGKSLSDKPIKYLLDAYCGSGLFAITLSGLFRSVLGIDVDVRAIQAARKTAQINNVENAGFIDADATDLFADVPFPSQETLCVIDPPRKGASEGFLRQLCTFGPQRVIYVSCNVHTQARDVGMMMNGFKNTKVGETEEQMQQYWRYEIEQLRGFDFFPQTGHVESVCVLNRVAK